MDMTINNVALSTMGATLLSVDYGYSKVTNYNDWLRNSKNPLFYGQDITYTTATFKILVEGANLGETDKNCSNIVNSMTKAIVKVNGSDWSIDGHLVDADNSNRISPLAREIQVNFEGVKIADRELLLKTMELGVAWSFEVKGNQDIPCRIEITPDMGYTTLALTINGEVYRIKDVDAESLSLVIDGEKGIVMADNVNKIADYTSWHFPTLKGGTNTIEVYNGAPTIRISYNGRWM